MAKNLFEEFDAVSSKQWKQQIQFELKGADYNNTLVWNSPEDIKVKPFYHSDKSEKPFTVNTKASQFRICQNIFIHDVEKSNYRALESIRRGAKSIRFTIRDEKINVERLLKNLPLDKINIYLNLNFLSIDFLKKMEQIATNKKAFLFCNLDPIGQLTKEGNWFSNLENDFEKLNTILTEAKKINCISVNTSLYQNAGATIVQQIAYGMAHANEYLNRIPSLYQPLVFQVSIGSNYFFEIAKLRAIRLLYSVIAAEYSYNAECHIIAKPTKRNKTIYDCNVNMLRTTTESMSAILGGADTISNLPYDAVFHKDNEFGDRIARNQLLILKYESHFDKVNNPADGVYYIESLTRQLAEKALLLFKDIEANGGFLKQLKEGTIQRKIQESADKEQERFDSGREVLLGTNKYSNKDERMEHDLELFPFVKLKPRKTLIVPIIKKRLAEKIEQERLKLDKQA